MIEPAGDISSPQISEAAEILRTVTKEAIDYLEGLEKRPVRSDTADDAAESFGGALAETGAGGMQAVHELLTKGVEGAVHSAGPRFFHFVMGGSTPAALGADWIASMLDQDNGAWVATPIASRLEVVALGWLKDLFGLPQSWGGVLTTGATMANFTGLACARRWWGLRHDADVDEDGFACLPPVPVFSSGYVHPSATKALAMLGMGRGTVRRLARDDAGRLDVDGLENELSGLKGAPGIVVANAGEVNAGDFDPIATMADLCEEHGAWLHVDGAFGLFARVSPTTAHLAEGVERAHSVISDGHKWLNVPYDCGFAFVHDPTLLPPVFRLAASYLPDTDEERPAWFNFGPESSRRARSLTVWATLRAYGRSGHRAMVERHVGLARRIAARVEAASDLELLAPAQLNIVCFRYRPEGWSDGAELDGLNSRIADEVLSDGRVYVGSTVYEGRVAFRPAIVNWLTREDDVDLLVDVVREIGARLTDG